MSDMKKIMILGAGVYQYPLIKTAKEMSLRTVVVSYKGNYPGFSIADEIEYIDIRDKEKVLEAAKKHDIDGICTMGGDVGVSSMGYVNDALGLSGVSYESAQLANNKYEMKQKFIEYGVRCAKGIKVKNVSEAQSAFYELGEDVVFKTVDSSGNRGIIHVKESSIINKSFNESLSHSKCDYIMVEEFLAGEEIGAEAFVYKGKVIYVLPHRKHVIETNAPIPIGQWVPAGLEDDIEKDVIRQSEAAIFALGLDNCAVNLDIIIKDSQSYIIEVGARAGGGACLPESVSTYFGFNHYANIIKASLGQNINFTFSRPTPNAAKMLFSDKAGVLAQLDYDKIPHPDLIEIKFDYKIGDKVPEFINKTHRIGHVIVRGDTAEEAKDRLEKVIEEIQIIIE